MNFLRAIRAEALLGSTSTTVTSSSENLDKRLECICKSPEILKWVKSSKPQVLILNGRESTDGAATPVSHYSSGLVRSAQDSPDDVIPLFWYCAQAPEAGVRAALACMFKQFFNGCVAELEVPDSSKVSKYNFEAQVQALVDLIKQQLKTKAFLVVLDCVDTYKDRALAADMQCLVEVLAKAVPKRPSNYIRRKFALLVTSSTTTKIAENCSNAVIADVPNIREYNDGHRSIS